MIRTLIAGLRLAIATIAALLCVLICGRQEGIRAYVRPDPAS